MGAGLNKSLGLTFLLDCFWLPGQTQIKTVKEGKDLLGLYLKVTVYQYGKSDQEFKKELDTETMAQNYNAGSLTDL